MQNAVFPLSRFGAALEVLYNYPELLFIQMINLACTNPIPVQIFYQTEIG